MAAGTLDFTIEQGATFNLLLTWKIDNVPVNLTNWTARLQARVDVEDTETVLTLTTENGGITLGGALGTISLDRTATQTALLPAGTYVYDLELISGVGAVTRLVQGELDISAEVTR
jgi:predicted MFS family arabinose efflux permease